MFSSAIDNIDVSDLVILKIPRICRGALVLTASVPLSPRVLDKQHPCSPGHCSLNINMIGIVGIGIELYNYWQQ